MFFVGSASLLAADNAEENMAKSARKTDGNQQWIFILSPYVAFAGMSGTVGVLHESAKVDYSYHQLSSNVKTAGSIGFEARKGKHAILLDAAYTKLSGDGDLRDRSTHVGVDATFEMTTIQASYGYQFFKTSNISLEAVGGLRYWNLNGRLQLDFPNENDLVRRYADVETWVDPVIGITAVPRLNDKISFPIKVDIGGFGVGSHFTSKGSIGVDYRPWRNFSIEGGYGYTYVNYSHGGTIFDVTFQGPYLGVNFIF